MSKANQLLLLFALVTAPHTAGADDSTTLRIDSAQPGAPGINQSLQREAAAAIDRSAQWLIAHQQEDGHWSNPDFPALTGLPVWALIGAGYDDHAAVHKGVAHILTCVQEDGGIWRAPTEERKGGGLANYNTAICMVALHLTGDPTHDEVILAARRFMARGQHTGADEYRGGAGYDPETGRPYADLSNSYLMYEGMRLTDELEDLRAQGGGEDLDWEAAEGFVNQLQNPDGGFIYKPGESKAGSETNQLGEVTFRSYGSMTYAGLLSLIYADVSPDDPRVQSALDWAKRHWTLDENPGTDLEGLYYFYNVLAKALAAAGEETFPIQTGQTINWRETLIRELLNRQQIDDQGNGYWVNEASRWMEADKVLVTSYALVALEIALGR